jgi:hypothetical protein
MATQMKRTPFSAVFIALAGSLSASCNNATPVASQQAPIPAPPALSTPDPRIVYELREKCGHDAREWFQHLFGNGTFNAKNFTSTSGFSNHYNEHLNRCYAVLATSRILRDQKTNKVRMSESKNLVDIAENKDRASYFKFSDMDRPMTCNFEDRYCATLEEWEGLVVPYMGQ